MEVTLGSWLVPLTFVGVAVAAAASLSLLSTFGRRRWPGGEWRLPPGPRGLPILGNLHQLFGTLLHRSFWQLSRQYGAVVYLKLGSMPAVVISSAEVAREVLKARDLDFCSRPSLAAADKFTYGRLVLSFSPYGDYWKEMRKLYVSGLLGGVGGGSSAGRWLSFKRVMEEEIALVVDQISSTCSSSSSSSLNTPPVDVSQTMVSLTNNMICRIAFGRKYEEEYAKPGGLHQILQERQALLSSFHVSDYFPWLGWIDRLSGLATRLEKNLALLDAFYEQVIREHLEDPQRGRKMMKKKKKLGVDLHAHKTDYDLVDLLLEEEEEEGSCTSFTTSTDDGHHKTNLHLRKDRIKAVLMDIYSAGTEPAASTLVWAMEELVRSPGAMKKAQEEVRGCVEPKARVEESDFHKLHYLKAVVKETLRLRCPVPLLLPRESTRRSAVGGYDIPPNTRVFINAWGICRDPKSWAVNPEMFIPERFMSSSSRSNNDDDNNNNNADNEKSKMIDFRGQDFEFIPFGSGRRICPTINLGMMMVELALANLLYAFEWRQVRAEMEMGGGAEEDMDIDETPGLTVHKRSPLRLLAKRRA